MKKIICAILIAIVAINVGSTYAVQSNIKKIEIAVSKIDSLAKSAIADSVGSILSDTIMSAKQSKKQQDASLAYSDGFDDNDDDYIYSEDSIIAIVAITVPFAAIVLIVLICLIMGYARRKAKYKLIEKAIENGYELQEYLFTEKPTAGCVVQHSNATTNASATPIINPTDIARRNSSIKGGIALTGVGFGLCLFWLLCDAVPMAGLCSIILIIGVGKLVVVYLEGNHNVSQASAPQYPMQPQSPIMPPPVPENDKVNNNSSEKPE